MPVSFWNDEDGSRLRAAYFEDYPGGWRHGDWIEITPRGSSIIHGRSDSTLNRGGARMGTTDFYAVVEAFAEVDDSLIDTSALSSASGDSKLICFLVLAPDAGLCRALRSELSPRQVPDKFVVIDEVSRTLNGKKCEVPVKKILAGLAVEKAASRGALATPTP